MVRVIPHEADRRVDVLVDGQPFTSYVYPETIEKPVLYPLRTAYGKVVTRGYPLEPTPGERVDHPHHVGFWFNYGDVNGLDFWNNSEAIPAADAPKMGTVVHRAIRRTESGKGQGTLETTAKWVNHAGKPLLREDTRYVFRAADDLRAVDRITTLTALNEPVSFTDNKEGLLGLRVTRALEQPATKPGIFTDARGRPTAVTVLKTIHHLPAPGPPAFRCRLARADRGALRGVCEMISDPGEGLLFLPPERQSVTAGAGVFCHCFWHCSPGWVEIARKRTYSSDQLRCARPLLRPSAQ